MNNNTITTLILAAGFSTRMQGEFKPLLPLPCCKGKNMEGGEASALEQLVSLYADMGIKHIYVVTGQREREALCKTLQKINAAYGHEINVEEVHNAHAEQGMFSSVCRGLEHIAKYSYSHCFMHPVDIPLVRPCTLYFLLQSKEGFPEHVLFPTFGEKKGHPPLLPLCHAPHILSFQAKAHEGLKHAMQALPSRHIPTADSHILYDMDTPEAYAHLRHMAAQRVCLLAFEAIELLQCLQVPAQVVAHSQAVARVAVTFAKAYNAMHGAGRIQVEQVEVGALLHDMCKGQAQHEKAAAQLLRHMGLSELAPLVENHTDMCISAEESVGEKELIYMADKFVNGTSVLPIAERFLQKKEKFAHIPEAVQNIEARLHRALSMEKRLDADLQSSAWLLAQRALQDI